MFNVLCKIGLKLVFKVSVSRYRLEITNTVLEIHVDENEQLEIVRLADMYSWKPLTNQNLFCDYNFLFEVKDVYVVRRAMSKLRTSLRPAIGKARPLILIPSKLLEKVKG